MPLYIFENKRTGERKEVFQRMNDKHVYSEDSKDEWRRVFTTSQLSVSSLSDIDPYDSKAFVRATANKKGTYGDLFDASKELSEKRKDLNGYDPIENKYYENYSAARKGKKHKNVVLKELKESLDKKGVELEL